MANNLLGVYCTQMNGATINAPIVINEENIALVVPSGTGAIIIYEESDGTSSQIDVSDSIAQLTQATALLVSTNPTTINGLASTGAVLVNPANINIVTSVTGSTNSGGSNVSLSVSGSPNVILGNLTQSQNGFNPSWSFQGISIIPNDVDHSNLVMYFDAGDAQNIELDSSGNVEKWIGEQNYYWYQSDASKRPGYDSSNGCLTFTGSEYMDLYDASTSSATTLVLDKSSYSMFFVINFDSQSGSTNECILSATNRMIHQKVSTSLGQTALAQTNSYPSSVTDSCVIWDDTENGQTGTMPGANGELFNTITNTVGNKLLMEVNAMYRRFPNSSPAAYTYLKHGWMRFNGTASVTPATTIYDEYTLGDTGSGGLIDTTVNAGFISAKWEGGSSSGVGDDMKVSRLGADSNSTPGQHLEGKVHEIAIYNGAMFGDQANYTMNNGFDEGNMPVGATAGQVEKYRGYAEHDKYNTIATYFTNKHSLSAI